MHELVNNKHDLAQLASLLGAWLGSGPYYESAVHAPYTDSSSFLFSRFASHGILYELSDGKIDYDYRNIQFGTLLET